MLELRTDDAIGLLYRVTAVLERCGVDIRSARVSSLGGSVVDAFYVTAAEAGRCRSPPQAHRGGSPADLVASARPGDHRPAPFAGWRSPPRQLLRTGIGVCDQVRVRPGGSAGNVNVVSRANDVRRGLRRISQSRLRCRQLRSSYREVPVEFSAVPAARGLYDPRHESDSCGVAFVADLQGRASHDIVAQALVALHNLDHRALPGPSRRRETAPA